MTEIINFPGINIDYSRFTPQALNCFREIPKHIMQHMLEDVFCPKCGKGTTIIDYSGKITGSDLILNGKCLKCWGEVERLIDRQKIELFKITF